jgi:hypothetical protein
LPLAADMPTHEELIAEQRSVATYAQPLSRLQISWGSILAGAVSLVAASLILWSLCLAVILSATSATVGAVKGALIAAFVTAIVTTLVGAFVGGMVAGYLPGNPRRVVTVAHGLIAWAVAFVFSALLHLSMISGATRLAAQALTATTSAAVQSAGAAVGGAASSAPGALDQKARGVLETLGYTPAEAAGMVESARHDLQQVLRGEGAPARNVQAGAQQVAATAKGALDTVLRWTAGYVWLWWATWLVAGGLAAAGAAAVVKRARQIPERERAGGSEPLQVTMLRPVRTTP